MKLVLLKPGNGQGMKELLKKMETAKGLSGSSDAAAARCAHNSCASAVVKVDCGICWT